MSMSKTRWTSIVVLVLLVLGGLAHLRYWYAARWHSLPIERARLVPPASERGSYLWAPFPHQNLRALEASVESPEELVAALGRLAGRDELSLPRFGALGIPPSREALVVWNDEGEPSVRLAVYPAARWVLRAAGTLAGNPLLAGGELARGRIVEWDGGVWRMGPASAPEPRPGEGIATRPPPVAGDGDVWLRWRHGDEDGPLPVGLYDLSVVDGALCLLPPGRRLEMPVVPGSVTLLGAERAPSGPRLFVLAASSSSRLGGFELPGFGVAAPTREEAMELLPASRWLERIEGLSSAASLRGALVATDESLLPLGRQLLEEWIPWMESEAVELTALLEPEEAGRLTDAVADLLEDIPLTSRSTRRQWRDLATLVEALSPFEKVCVAAGSPRTGA